MNFGKLGMLDFPHPKINLHSFHLLSLNRWSKRPRSIASFENLLIEEMNKNGLNNFSECPSFSDEEGKLVARIMKRKLLPS